MTDYHDPHHGGKRQLDRRTIDRLTKLLGMLGSDHVGERSNAAAAANKLLHDHGRAWQEFIAQHHRDEQPRREEAPDTLAGIIELCLGHKDAINDWEISFLINQKLQLRRGLSRKQVTKLQDIYEKVRAYLDLAAECGVNM